MALGRLSTINHAAAATLSGGEWAEALPLANLQDDRFVSAPARQLDPATLADAQFDAALDRPRRIDLVGVLFHTLSLGARYRISAIPAGGDLDAPGWTSGWRPVYGRWFASSQLVWEEENWWTGQPLESDLDLWPRHLLVPLELAFAAAAIRVEFDDADNAAGYFDLGGLWIAASWSPRFNFERGRELGLTARDQSDEAPSGRDFHELRQPRRTLTLDWAMLSDAEAQTLFDAGARVRRVRPVLFVPDAADEPGRVREAYPANFETPPAPVFKHDGVNAVSATLKEIIA